MRPQTILLVGGENLLMEGLKRLLVKDRGQCVVHVNPVNLKLLVRQIWQIRPYYVIMPSSLAIGPTDLLAHLGAYPAVQIIVVNEHNNHLVVYEQRACLNEITFSQNDYSYERQKIPPFA